MFCEGLDDGAQQGSIQKGLSEAGPEAEHGRSLATPMSSPMRLPDESP